MINKILVANRGEIALRVIRTCREMGIKTVAVYSTADKNSLHTKLADESVCIGKPESSDSYLNIPRIIAAAEITNADAIHPGYGFLSENANFARICEKNKIIFIGPKPEHIIAMGDKSVAKTTVKKFGLHVIPGSDGVVNTLDAAKKIGDKIKYPIIMKAVAGGGGKGMRVLENEKQLIKDWEIVKTEAKKAFGNGDMYIEKYLDEPRHIEIQVFGDKYGNACHLSERDCSIQRRNQKLIEETPSPFITKSLREKMGKLAVKLCEGIKYENAGTLEFLMDKDKNFYFMEMNTRIQVEHPITEEVINYDLIREQIKISMGEPIKNKAHYPRDVHVIECRINAEDPNNNFLPSPGKITSFHSPGGHGIRIDTHVYAGYTIVPYYDSMIAKLISVARTREESITKMRRALREMIIEGVKSTIPFHRAILKSEKFIRGEYNTKFVEKEFMTEFLKMKY